MSQEAIRRLAEKLAAMEQCYPLPWQLCWAWDDGKLLLYVFWLAVAVMVAGFAAAVISWRWH